MSDRTEAVRSSVDGEWRTVSEIIRRAGLDVDDARTRESARTAIKRMEKTGMIECRRVSERAGMLTKEWRLKGMDCKTDSIRSARRTVREAMAKVEDAKRSGVTVGASDELARALASLAEASERLARAEAMLTEVRRW